MKIAKVWTLADIGLKNLIGCGARNFVGGKSWFSCISPYDVQLGTLVLVYEPGDVIYRETCLPEARFLFEKKHKNDLSYRVAPMTFEGRKSPCLFIPIYRPMSKIYEPPF